MARRKSSWKGLYTKDCMLAFEIKQELGGLAMHKKHFNENILKKLVAKVELIAISHAMNIGNMSASQAANYMGMYPASMHKKLKQLGVTSNHTKARLVEDANTVSVRLSRTGKHIVEEVKLLMGLTGRDYQEAKFLLDNVPKVICRGMPRGEAKDFIAEYHRASPGSALYIEEPNQEIPNVAFQEKE